MARVYGNPEGASLADWPVDYDEMEPYYSRAEQELGVAGEEGGLTSRTPRSPGYPMPAFGTEPARELLGGAADRLGWGWGPIPLALNSVPARRPAAPACAARSASGTPARWTRRTVPTTRSCPARRPPGTATSLYDAEAIEVRDGAGRRRGHGDGRRPRGEPVELVRARRRRRRVRRRGRDRPAAAGQRHRQRPARPAPARPPVRHDALDGRRAGEDGTSARATRSRPSTTCTPTSIPWGGGVLVDLMSAAPAHLGGEPDAGRARAGAQGHKTWMRERPADAFGVFGMGQEIPMPTSARDPRRGPRPLGPARRRACARACTAPRVEVEDGMAEHGRRAGSSPPAPGTSTGSAAARRRRRRASTRAARPGWATDPATGATDPFGRPWGTRRIVVCDSSLHPTNGSVNPTLTIVANAFRVAEHLVADWPR